MTAVRAIVSLLAVALVGAGLGLSRTCARDPDADLRCWRRVSDYGKGPGTELWQPIPPDVGGEPGVVRLYHGPTPPPGERECP